MKSILVVEDNPEVRNTIRAILSDAGFPVQSVEREDQAINALLKEPFDVAFIDIRLHGGDEDDVSGIALALAFKRINQEGQIFMLSSSPIPKSIAHVVRYLGVKHIRKSPDMDVDILDAIKQLDDYEQNKFYTSTTDATSLHITLDEQTHPNVRSRGRHVYGIYDRANITLNPDKYERWVKDARRDSRFEINNIGMTLWQDVFGNHREVSDTYHEAKGKSKPLTLIFETPRGKLTNLPLEFMHSSEGYLVLLHPFVRFVNEITTHRDVISPDFMARKDKLRILLIASNTYPSIDGVDQEVRELKNFFDSQMLRPVEVEVVSTDRASINYVERKLQGKYDIIHYSGHGKYNNKSPEESSLLFWEQDNKGGAIVHMQAARLTYLLQQSQNVSFVYLSCCEGTTTGNEIALQDDDFLGLADAVLKAGVPTVLGYRWPVRDSGAKKLALKFYKSLLEQGNIEIALWHARSELAANDRNDNTWLSPVLISQH